MRQAPPPSRYRIYERNRRLVVVDQWAGSPGTTTLSALPPSASRDQPGPGQSRRLAFDGRSAFTTHALFDAKGPRTIILDSGSIATINGIKLSLIPAVGVAVFIGISAPYLLLPLVALTQPKLRKAIRAATTAWLDRVADTPS